MSDNINRKPANFDWVAERGGCSVRQMFEQLRLVIAQDVEAINKHIRPMDERPRSFKIAEDKKTIKVYEDDPHFDSGPSVLFLLKGNVIKVKDGETGQSLFELSITLNDAGECRFTIGGEERDSWQVRRKALEGIFFRS